MAEAELMKYLGEDCNLTSVFSDLSGRKEMRKTGRCALNKEVPPSSFFFFFFTVEKSYVYER